MGKYSANSANAFESNGGNAFRIAKDGEKVRVVFLYAGPESIDGWACHRFARGKSGYTYTVDCPRSPKDPLEKCPACADKQALYTRVFVRMLNLNTNEVTIWDRASSFRKDLVGMMEYFNPLYGRVYEITRRGTGLQTQYQYQSLNESGITPERYEELVKQAEAVAADYVRPIDSYQTVLAQCAAASEQEAKDGVQVDNNGWGQAPQNGWGQPQTSQNGWGQAPQTNNWGQPPQTNNWGQPPQNNGWGQQAAPQQSAPAPQQSAPAPQQSAPSALQNNGWGQPQSAQTQAAPNQTQATPQQSAPQQSAPAPQQNGWGQPPTGNWGQAPQSWGQNSGN